MLNTHCNWGHEKTAENTIIDPTGRRGRQCRKCHNASQRKGYKLGSPHEHRDKCREQKAILVKEQGGKCIDCGGVFPDCCYHFHHKNPEDKLFGLGSSMRHSLMKLRAEAAKCDLLCANCHAIKTYGDAALSIIIREGKRRSLANTDNDGSKHSGLLS